MKRNLSIQLKAAFLLVVFFLNTVIGFACSFGFNMGFNSSHHQTDETFETHKHYPGGTLHQEHNGLFSHHHPAKESKENCCNDQAVKFEKVNKLVPESLNTIVSPTFYNALPSSFYFGAFAPSTKTLHSKYFERSHHPPISDIRIAIQSFQV
jgi:hypothetical protein